jgi:hypothetical protein
MNATAFKQIEITQHLSLLTEQQLEQINHLLDTVTPLC